MQPKLKIVEIEHAGRTVEALEFVPVVMPDIKDAKGRLIDPNAAAMPRAPMHYILDDSDEAHLVKALVRSSAPIKQQSSYVIYGNMDAAKRAEVLATVDRLNKKMLATFGSGVVAQPVADSLSFSFRHTQEMWGGRSADELNPAAVFKILAPASISKPAVNDVTAESVNKETAAKLPFIRASVLQSVRPGSARKHNRAPRMPAPAWAKAPPLPCPGEDATFNFPTVELLQHPTAFDARIMRITPAASHKGHAVQELVISDSAQIYVLERLLKQQDGVNITARDTKDWPKHAVDDAVQQLNQALTTTYSGLRIKRYVFKRLARRSNKGQLVLKLDARKWGPMPEGRSSFGSQIRANPPKAKPKQSDIANAPTISVQGQLRSGKACLVIEPKPHHTGEKTISIPLLNEAQMHIARTACSGPEGSKISGLAGDGLSYLDILSAVGYIQRKMAEQQCGVVLRHYRNNGENVVFRYDAIRWGLVPRYLAIKGTIAPPKPMSEGFQYALPLRLKPRRNRPEAAAPDEPAVLIKRGRGRPARMRHDWLEKLRSKETQPELPFYPEKRGGLAAAMLPTRRKAYVDPNQLRLPIILDEAQPNKPARLMIGAVDLGGVEVEITPRQAQLFRLVVSNGRTAIKAFHAFLGDEVPVAPGEDKAEAERNALKKLKGEIQELDHKMVTAIIAVSPQIIPPTRANSARIIACSGDVHVRERRVRLALGDKAA